MDFLPSKTYYFVLVILFAPLISPISAFVDEERRKMPTALPKMTDTWEDRAPELLNHDFSQRLLEASSQQTVQVNEHHQHHDFTLLYTAVPTVFLLLGASHVLTQGMATQSILEALKTVLSIAWIPILWIRPTHFWEDSFSYLQAILRSQPAQLFGEIVSSCTLETLRKMVVTTLWTRAWNRLFKDMSAWWDDESSNRKPHPMVSALRKKMRSILKSAVQKQMHAVIIAAGSFVWTQIQAYWWTQEDD